MTLACVAALVVLGDAAAPADLDSRVRAEVAGFRGRVSVFARNVDTGATYALQADDLVRTASTIKLPILVEAFARVAEGKARWDETLTLAAEARVGGSGILSEFSPGLRLTLRDAVHLMIVISDNTATNLVLDRLGTDSVNDRLDALGFPKTRLLRKVFGGSDTRARTPALEPYGLGVTTPREMATLLERIERGEVVSLTASKEMIEILKRQQVHEGIGRTLANLPVANKTGALDHMRGDVGVVYSARGRIAMALYCDEMPEVLYRPDNPGLLLISRLSALLADGLKSPLP